MNLALDHWHIEVSSICTLKCPRCTRAEVPETLLNRQLTLEFFRTQIGETTIKNMRKISFCGDDGDPIYAKQFLEIVEWIKNINPSIQLLIITNGSYKTKDWWKELTELLTNKDKIIFSVDGIPENFTQYRKNADWESIELGMKTSVASQCNTTWRYIPFSFNETNINQAKEFSEFDLSIKLPGKKNTLIKTLTSLTFHSMHLMTQGRHPKNT